MNAKTVWMENCSVLNNKMDNFVKLCTVNILLNRYAVSIILFIISM